MTRILFILTLAIAVAMPPMQALPETGSEMEFACPVAIVPANSRYRCINGDQLTLRMPYTGVGPGVNVGVSGPGSPTVGGDDPAVVTDGVIELIDLGPAASYTLTIIGFNCVGSDAIIYNFTTPAYVCGLDWTVLINEVLPEPGSDANEDGVATFLEEQFVEIFNPDTEVEIDLDRWDLVIGGVVRYTFPPATVLRPKQLLTVFGGGVLSDPCHLSPAGFLSINSNGDAVALAPPSGGTVHSMFFPGGAVLPNVSLALDPDGNAAGGFVPHTSIVTNPVTYSPCFSNHQAVVILPIALTSFSAIYHKGKVLLNWSTAHEDDHAYFDVQRSADGREWETLESVREPIAGIETREEDRKYEAEDSTPPAGLVYYRLLQVDQDGATRVYGPKSVNVADQFESVSLYPNPAQDLLRVVGFAQAGDFEILDSCGKQWLRGKLSDASNTSVNIAALPAGMYFLRVLDKMKPVSTVRWVKR